MSEDTGLSLEVQQETFTLGDRKFIVREANGKVARKYRATISKGAKWKDGVVEVSDLQPLMNMEYMVVAGCCYEIVERDGNDVEKSLEEKDVEKWPSRLIKRLYAWIKDNSEFDAEDEEGNEQEQDEE